MDWIQKVYKHIDENFSGHRIHKHLDHVIRLYDNLEVENNPKMLLHGDLHHGNILSSDEWRVIDPKGVIGHKSLEIGRYMNNQIQEDGMILDECIDHMIEGFSEIFKLSPDTMTLSFYIDMVLSTSWFFEDHEPDMTEINNRIDIIDQIYKRL
jgi:streptomycin 6-kinase